MSRALISCRPSHLAVLLNLECDHRLLCSYLLFLLSFLQLLSELSLGATEILLVHHKRPWEKLLATILTGHFHLVDDSAVFVLDDCIGSEHHITRRKCSSGVVLPITIIDTDLPSSQNAGDRDKRDPGTLRHWSEVWALISSAHCIIAETCRCQLS